MKKLTAGLLVLALAPALRADEAKKSEAKTYRVPYKLTDTNHVLVRVKINSKGPYNFILDTGAPTLFVSTGISKKLGVTAASDGWGKFDRVEIEGGVVLRNVKGRVENPFQLEGMNGLGLAGVQLHGIIGYTVLAKYRLEFDFTIHKMGWTPLDFKPAIPLGLGGQAAVSGLDTLGGAMKLLGAFIGKKPEARIVLRGFLGIALEMDEGGVVVKTVLASSPAAEAGVRVGDRISQFQGKSVGSVASVKRLAERLAPDETAKLTVARAGETRTLQIKAGRGL